MPNLPSSSYRGPPSPLGRANSVGPGNYSRTSVPPPSYSRSNSSSVSAAVHTGITVLPLGLMRANSIGPSSQLRQRSASPSPFKGVPIQQQQHQQLPLPLPPPPPPAPVPTAASASSKNQLNSGPGRISTSSLATTSSSFLKPYYGHSTEELLDKHSQGLLPILLYIRNFNEYRRHRPVKTTLKSVPEKMRMIYWEEEKEGLEMAEKR